MKLAHRPKYEYCPDPDECCSTWGPIAINCRTCGESWPCATKRSHGTEVKAKRISRWTYNRIMKGY